MANAFIRRDDKNVVKNKGVGNGVRVANGNERRTNKERSSGGDALIEQAGQKARQARVLGLWSNG